MTFMKKTNLLSQVSFSILLALSLKPRHGYEIIKQVEEDSLGKIQLGPGTLYGAIKQLREQRLIRELPTSKTDRRRYYELTEQGQKQLTTELDYFQKAVELAAARNALRTPRIAKAAL